MKHILTLILVTSMLACSSPPLREAPFPSPELVEQDFPELATGLFNASFPFTCSPIRGCEAVFPPRGPDAVEIAYLSSGEASLGVRLRMLQEARYSIRVQALIFHGDESGIAIAQMLKLKKRQGVDVRVIIDSVSNIDWNSQWMYYDLQRHGIPVQGYEALGWQVWHEYDTEDIAFFNKRYHEKLFLVDAETDNARAVIGGLNIGNEYFRVVDEPAERWRDQDVLVRGAIVRDMATTFDRNYDFLESRKSVPTTAAWRIWQEIEQEEIPIGFIRNRDIVANILAVQRDYARLEPHYHPATARFLHNRPREQETYILQVYETLIRAAQHEILIENAYFVPTRPIRDALRDAASRGVTVHIITNSKETNDLPTLTSAGRYYYADLMAGNDPYLEVPPLRVFEWEGHHFGQGTVHSKFAVFDRSVAIVGSYNLDPRSERLNSETAIVFKSDHVVGRLTEDFYRDLQYSREIPPAEAALYNEPDDLLLKWEMDLARAVEDQL